MSKAQEQAKRFVDNHCPAPVSRKKLKSIMWRRTDLDGESVSKMIGTHDAWKARTEANLKKIPFSKENTFEVFIDALHSLGGEFHAVRDDSEKKITGRRSNRLESNPVEEITSHLAGVRSLNQLSKQLLTLTENTPEWHKNLDSQRRINKSYYRDGNGSLRKFVHNGLGDKKQ